MKFRLFRIACWILVGSLWCSLFGPYLPVVQAAESGPTLRALKLNGTDAYLEVADDPRLTPNTGLTIEAWIYRNSATRCETVVGKDWINSYWLGFCTSKLRFYTRGEGSAVDSVASIPAGVWTHIAVTYDGTTRRYYINGILDTASIQANGPLIDTSSALGIGFDPGQATLHFSGMLDEVRIWRIARNQSDIQADMHRQIGTQGGLEAVWRMNGSAHELLNQHPATQRGDVRYETNGPLPSDIQLPLVSVAPTVDGTCGAIEYSSAERVGLRSSAPSKTVYLQHTSTDLYICIPALDQGGGRSAAIALDRNLSRDSVAMPDDYRFIFEQNGTISTQAGNGAGGFQPVTLPSGSWSGAVTVGFEFYWGAELRLSKSLWTPAGTIGLDVAERGAPASANHWPAGGIENNPSTWARVGFGSSVSAPTHFFSGTVADPTDRGLPNVTVRLLLSAVGGTSLNEVTQTDPSGNYTLSYRGFASGSFTVEEIDPRGTFSLSAAAGADGSVISPNHLAYNVKPGGGVYSGGTFVDSSDPFDRPSAAPFDRHYLIVYSAPVTEADLWPVIQMKQLQGFQIETVTTQRIQSTVAGRDLTEKIRNWLKSRWESYRPATIYALLIGRGDVIAVPDYGDPSFRPVDVLPDDPRYVPLIYTDWYYADLDSNWDIDNDGRIGECLTADARPASCPTGSPVLNEGPFGTSPGPEDDWTAEISLGRVAVNDPAQVRLALITSATSESSGSSDKLNALLAGSFWSYENLAWNSETGMYEGSWNGVKPYGDDSAEHLEVMLKPILETYLNNVTRLYNSTAPGNNPALSGVGRATRSPMVQAPACSCGRQLLRRRSLLQW